MRSLSFTLTILLTSFLSSVGLLRSASAHDPDPCDGLREWPLFVGDEPADAVIARLRADPSSAESYIKDLGIDLSIPALVGILRQLKESPVEFKGLPQALQGIGGFTTVLFLQKLLPLDVNAAPIGDPVFYGKIRDFTYIAATGEGHLAVDICIDFKEFVPLGEDRRVFYHWDIEVAAGGFSVAQRTSPTPPSDPAQYGNPFPSLNITMPAMAIDPSDPRSIWRRGLDHKLHARGMTIEIRNVYRRKLSEPDLVRVSESETDLYQSTMETCIDLFTEGPPPATFGELSGNGYCLGRCEHPPIVNSGD